MLLSIQQRYILEALRKLRCVRISQMLILTREEFRPKGIEISQRRMDAMLHQLRSFNNDIRTDGELVYLAGVRPDSRRLEAVDVMLELTGGAPASFGCSGASPPFLLRFSVKGVEERCFTVGTLLGTGKEPLLWLERVGPGRVIWISDSGAPPDGLSLASNHFFAARQAGGTHRFYGSSDPSREP